MSRLGTLSPAALKAMFSPDGDDNLIVLATITAGPTVIRIADGYTKRLSETADEVIYGVTSNGQDYVFLPFAFVPPTEEQMAAPHCSITMHDVTRYLTPLIRMATEAPTVSFDLVLHSTPNVVEISFPDFLMGAIQYDQNTVTAELTVESLTNEPFPAYNFTPSAFPGLF